MVDNVSKSSDIETTLATLQEEIRRHRLALGDLGAFEKPDPMAPVRQHQWVNSHLPIGWPIMPKGIIPKLLAYAKKITRRLLRWYINPIVDQQNAYNAAATETLATVQGQSEKNAQRLRDLDVQMPLQVFAALPERLQALEEQVGRLRQVSETQQSEQSHWQEMTRMRLQRLENWRKREGPTKGGLPSSASVAPMPPVDYFLLGLQYRSEEQLAERLHDYDDLFVALHEAQEEGTGPDGAVLDIGCGKGELVGHLQELGLEAYGLEIDRDAIEAAQSLGLDVRDEDAFAHLEDLPDDSLAAITLIQVIEHFEIGDLLRLLELAYKKLAPGGFIVAETINTLCLVALANAYLLDPSHRTPLPPLMTRFLMEQAGFWRIETRFLRPVPPPTRLEAVPTADEDVARSLNTNIEKLNNVLYGPQDYTVIAYKPEA